MHLQAQALRNQNYPEQVLTLSCWIVRDLRRHGDGTALWWKLALEGKGQGYLPTTVGAFQ